MLKLALLSVLGGVVAGIFAIAENSQPATVLAAGLVLVGIEVFALTKMAGGFTAAVVPVLAVNSVLLSSLFLWDGIRAESIVSIRLRVTEGYHIQAAVIGIVFSVAFTVGALLAGPRSVRVSIAQIGDSLAELGRSFRVPNGTLVAVGYAGIFLTIYARQGALLSGRYLEADGSVWAVALSNAVAPLAILVLCIAAAKPGPWRWLAILGIGIWFLLLFGRASRTIAVFPAFILFGRAFASGTKIRAYSIGIAVAATVFLMQLPLVGRANTGGVGIIPLSEQLFTRTDEVFAGFSLSAILGNILFSGPLTGVVANRPIPSEAFWISINPMPGTLAGWPEIKDSLRLSRSTPYNALGELGAHGWVALVVVAAAIGFLLALSTRFASTFKGAYAMTATLLVLGLTGFFSVSILQYNLRSSVRLIWYILAGVLVIWLASVAFRRRGLVDVEDGSLSAHPRGGNGTFATQRGGTFASGSTNPLRPSRPSRLLAMNPPRTRPINADQSTTYAVQTVASDVSAPPASISSRLDVAAGPPPPGDGVGDGAR